MLYAQNLVPMVPFSIVQFLSGSALLFSGIILGLILVILVALIYFGHHVPHNIEQFHKKRSN